MTRSPDRRPDRLRRRDTHGRAELARMRRDNERLSGLLEWSKELGAASVDRMTSDQS